MGRDDASTASVNTFARIAVLLFARRTAAANSCTASVSLSADWQCKPRYSCRPCGGTGGCGAAGRLTTDFVRWGRPRLSTVRHFHSYPGLLLLRCTPLRRSPRRALLRSPLRRTARRQPPSFLRGCASACFAPADAVASLSQ